MQSGHNLNQRPASPPPHSVSPPIPRQGQRRLRGWWQLAVLWACKKRGSYWRGKSEWTCRITSFFSPLLYQEERVMQMCYMRSTVVPCCILQGLVEMYNRLVNSLCTQYDSGIIQVSTHMSQYHYFLLLLLVVSVFLCSDCSITFSSPQFIFIFIFIVVS